MQIGKRIGTKCLGMIGLLTGLLFTTAIADTNVMLEGNHQVLSSVDDGNGLNSITLEFTLNNTSSIDLSNLSLDLIPDRNLIIVNSSPLTVTSLNAGTSATVDWTIQSPMPSDLLGSGIPMNLVGGAQDSLGNQVNVSVAIN